MTARAPRVLVVSAAFAPHRSPSAHRCRFLAMHASRYGWEAGALGVRPEDYADRPDEELLRLIPPDVRIWRSGAWSHALTRRFGVGDLGMRSYFPMRRELGRICASWKPDVLYIPGWPFYTFRMGLWAKRKFGIPYVLDYTDPWVFPHAPEQDSPTSKLFWADKLARVVEPPVVRNASHVFAVSDRTHDSVRERMPELPDDFFSSMPFGFEPSDFDALRAQPRVNEFWNGDDGNLHLAYVGAMLPTGYETLRALFSALLLLRSREPDRYDRVRLHFFGTTYDPNPGRGLVAPVAEEMGLGGVVSELPRRIPYLDALNVLTSANGVLSLGNSEAHYTASKIYPCILSRRPLLALYHEASTVGDVLRDAGAGEIVTYGDVTRAGDRVDAIAAALARLVERAADPAPTPPPRLEGMRPYSAEWSARHILEVCDRIIGRRGGGSA
jgi:hypothetical protein